MVEINKEDIVSRECRFVVHCPSNMSSNDIHLIKEVLHLKDGTLVPRVRLLPNFKRDFYVTKPGFRKHKQKKEWESVERLYKYQSTQARLQVSIARALGQVGFKGPMKKLLRSPYVYGADILSTALIKHKYMTEYPVQPTKYSVCVLDLETDVVTGSNDPIMGTISMKDKAYIVVREDFIKGHANPVQRIYEAIDKHISQHIQERNVTVEIDFRPTSGTLVQALIERAHKWMPDFVAIWNMDFDIPKILASLEAEGINAADVFSDPSVPLEYRHCNYRPGSPQKVTASGKVTPVKPANRWHTLYCPASFYVIDAMCTYRIIRLASPEEPSYSLDNILKKELKGIKKLKFEAAKHLEGTLEWHIFMQQNYPFDYIAYNLFDCMSMEILDEKTNDLAVTLPMFSAMSDFRHFKSQPRRLVDALHFEALEKGLVIATTSDEMTEEVDSETLDLTGWIITLPANLVVNNGMQLFKDVPNLTSNCRSHLGDLDVSASYPNGISTCNISKETTRREIIDIVGIPEEIYRNQSLNLNGGHTNASEFCQFMFKAPSFEQLLTAFEQEVNVTNSEQI
jgi:DNA polymerase elongation subunit (family B)